MVSLHFPRAPIFVVLFSGVVFGIYIFGRLFFFQMKTNAIKLIHFFLDEDSLPVRSVEPRPPL